MPTLELPELDSEQ
jgi:dynein heavy chain